MPDDLAAIDASVILSMVVPEAAVEDAAQRVRDVRTQQRMVEPRKSGVRFFIPSPVISELSRDGAGEKVARTALEHLGGIRVEGLGLRAARVAGEMLRVALKTRTPEMSRTAMKYDAMIAAVAHAARARFMVTANPKDYEKYLGIINSPVRVLAPGERDQIESEGQIGMVLPMPKPKSSQP